MDSLETYSFLFADSVMDSLVLPPYTGYVFKTMLGFGGYHPILLLALTSLGVVAGMMINWLLGRMLISCRDREWIIVETPRLDKCAAFFRKFLAWILLFAWFPGIGGLISVVAGFSKVRFWVALLLVSIGTVTHYAFILYKAGLFT